MKIADFLEEKAVTAELKSMDKDGVLKELTGLLADAGVIKDQEGMVKILLEREALGSTGIGNGIAIPHGKSEKIKKLTAALGICREGMDFNSLDGE
ncbi:MAG: PTS sugar transporter subunit IIA, partial [Candidatus Omnitrophica bacterium]|nr:PTS sugar transporter subunit IIA [Candidatus Omnitrophota bacterium]